MSFTDRFKARFILLYSILFLLSFSSIWLINTAAALTIEEIIKLKKAGVSDEVILEMIRKENREKPLKDDIKKQNCVERDGQYCGYANGVVYDTQTGLEWVAGPDRNTTWDEAKSWVSSLSVAGGGWRMPARNELRSLYQKGAGSRNMTRLLKTTGWYVWSGEGKGSSGAWYFGFYVSRGRDLWGYRGYFYGDRGFAVRSRSNG